MKKVDINKLLKTVQRSLSKHSPEILTGLGIVGTLSSTVLAVSATPKALKKIEKKKEELGVRELSKIDVVKAVYKSYIPAVASATISVGCLIGANSVNEKRNAALAAAYTLSEAARKEYREKVLETIGEKKEQDIRDKIAKDHVEEIPNKQNIIITGPGNQVCIETFTGKIFESTIDKLKRIETELNKRLMTEMYVSLNDFYYEVGLPMTTAGSEMGWNMNNGWIEMEFSSQILDDQRACVVVSYTVEPRYKYTDLM